MAGPLRPLGWIRDPSLSGSRSTSRSPSTPVRRTRSDSCHEGSSKTPLTAKRRAPVFTDLTNIADEDFEDHDGDLGEDRDDSRISSKVKGKGRASDVGDVQPVYTPSARSASRLAVSDSPMVQSTSRPPRRPTTLRLPSREEDRASSTDSVSSRRAGNSGRTAEPTLRQSDLRGFFKRQEPASEPRARTRAPKTRRETEVLSEPRPISKRRRIVLQQSDDGEPQMYAVAETTGRETRPRAQARQPEGWDGRFLNHRRQYTPARPRGDDGFDPLSVFGPAPSPSIRRSTSSNAPTAMVYEEEAEDPQPEASGDEEDDQEDRQGVTPWMHDPLSAFSPLTFEKEREATRTNLDAYYFAMGIKHPGGRLPAPKRDGKKAMEQAIKQAHARMLSERAGQGEEGSSRARRELPQRSVAQLGDPGKERTEQAAHSATRDLCAPAVVLEGDVDEVRLAMASPGERPDGSAISPLCHQEQAGGPSTPPRSKRRRELYLPDKSSSPSRANHGRSDPLQTVAPAISPSKRRQLLAFSERGPEPDRNLVSPRAHVVVPRSSPGRSKGDSASGGGSSSSSPRSGRVGPSSPLRHGYSMIQVGAMPESEECVATQQPNRAAQEMLTPGRSGAQGSSLQARRAAFIDEASVPAETDEQPPLAPLAFTRSPRSNRRIYAWETQFAGNETSSGSRPGNSSLASRLGRPVRSENNEDVPPPVRRSGASQAPATSPRSLRPNTLRQHLAAPALRRQKDAHPIGALLRGRQHQAGGREDDSSSSLTELASSDDNRDGAWKKRRQDPERIPAHPLSSSSSTQSDISPSRAKRQRSDAFTSEDEAARYRASERGSTQRPDVADEEMHDRSSSTGSPATEFDETYREPSDPAMFQTPARVLPPRAAATSARSNCSDATPRAGPDVMRSSVHNDRNEEEVEPASDETLPLAWNEGNNSDVSDDGEVDAPASDETQPLAWDDEDPVTDADAEGLVESIGASADEREDETQALAWSDDEPNEPSFAESRSAARAYPAVLLAPSSQSQLPMFDVDVSPQPQDQIARSPERVGLGEGPRSSTTPTSGTGADQRTRPHVFPGVEHAWQGVEPPAQPAAGSRANPPSPQQASLNAYGFKGKPSIARPKPHQATRTVVPSSQSQALLESYGSPERTRASAPLGADLRDELSDDQDERDEEGAEEAVDEEDFDETQKLDWPQDDREGVVPGSDDSETMPLSWEMRRISERQREQEQEHENPGEEDVSGRQKGPIDEWHDDSGYADGDETQVLAWDEGGSKPHGDEGVGLTSDVCPTNPASACPRWERAKANQVEQEREPTHDSGRSSQATSRSHPRSSGISGSGSEDPHTWLPGESLSGLDSPTRRFLRELE